MALPRSMQRTKQVILVACPSEIISQIVGNLDKSSLSRLALSSRFLNVFTTPYLYDHIEFLSHSRDWSSPESIAFRNLTLLLLERPHLAGYVRHFTMRNDFSRSYLATSVPRSLHKAISVCLSSMRMIILMGMRGLYCVSS